MLRLHFGTRLVVQPLDLGHVQTVAFLMSVHDAKAPLAARSDAEQAVIELLEIDDACERADRHGLRRPARFASRDDERDAEAGILAHAAADHVEIARLENPQPQRTAGEQHSVQREQRNAGVGRATHG
jgi:hypothetical protein